MATKHKFGNSLLPMSDLFCYSIYSILLKKKIKLLNFPETFLEIQDAPKM